MPVHDSKIADLTFHQLVLYQALISNDREREILHSRDTVEYGMIFMKPEVMQKILRDRENENNNAGTLKEPAFNQQLEQMFGHSLLPKTKREEPNVDTIQVVKDS